MELWDLYDERRQKLNKTHDRQEKMKSGEYHIGVEVWTVNEHNEVLFTLRHPSKKDYPNYWENTGGSLLAGESSREGAVRELFEETGIKASEDELFLLGTVKGVSAFYDIYIVRKNYRISELTLQEGETVDAKWVSLEDLNVLLQSDTIAPPIVNRLAIIRKQFDQYINNK